MAARVQEAARAAYRTRRVRWLGFTGYAIFLVVALVTRLPRDPGLSAVAAAVSLSAGVLLVYAESRVVLAAAALATAGIAVLGSGSASNVGWFAVCVLAILTVLAGGRWIGVAFCVASLLLFGGEALADPDPGWAAWAVGTGFSALAALAVQRDRALLEQLRAAQAGLAERSRAEERVRIARELHDVIAHSLTVSLLHISSARLSVEYDPADAARALDEAERLGRRSLDEVRTIVGMARPDSAGGMAVPVPALDAVNELVDQFRGAGAHVSLSVEGNLAAVPATTGSTAYRIVQESLTNAAKHAPGSPVAVSVHVDSLGVELTVDSAGPPGTGAGMGLASMSERAQAVGGRCVAGPGGDGWRVHATLPLGPSRSPEPNGT